MKEANQPVLIVVMGTSGSGKSTIGSKLAQSLGIPFVDGDELHPAANITKMSLGEPLDDTDRAPWLRFIRKKAVELTESEHIAAQESDSFAYYHSEGQLIQVRESKYGPRSNGDQRVSKIDHFGERIFDRVRSAHAGDLELANKAPKSEKWSQRPGIRKACVIACSALRREYRDLLRGTIVKLVGEKGFSTESDETDTCDIEVLHVYISVGVDVLMQRMQSRKGHFMRESMLQSQLATLEQPDPNEEPGIVVLENGLVHQIVAEGTRLLQARLATH